ncbi:MAG: rhomboid family intramembrane serine protease [Patescibacteria group bacterium]
MIPLKDHNPNPKFPWLTIALIVANILVFLLVNILLSSQLENTYDSYALVPDEITRGDELHTLLTSMFLHGGWLHIIGNMWFLFIFGDNLESELGRFRYLGLYLVSGLIASAAQILANPDSTVFHVGASGAIAGVMGAYILLYPNAKIDTLVTLGFYARRTTLPALFMLGFWFVIQLISGFTSIGESAGVAFWAHAGGFAAGAILVLPLKLSLNNRS